MFSPFRLALAALALALLPAPLLAEGKLTGKYTPAKGRTAISETVKVKVRQQPGKKDEEVPFQVWVTVAGERPRYGPAATAKEVPGLQLKFMDSCYVFEVDQDSGYLFVGKAKDEKDMEEPYGWVRKEALLQDPSAIRMEATGIYRKAMIVNTRATIKAGHELFLLATDPQEALDGGKVPEELTKELAKLGSKLSPKTKVEKGLLGQWSVVDVDNSLRFEVQKKTQNGRTVFSVADSFAQAAVFDAPRADATRLKIYRLFDFFYVYAIVKDKGKQFVLLGQKESIDDQIPGRRSRDVVVGWAPKERLALWDTREGLEWDRQSARAGRTKSGAILASEEDAHNWDEGKALVEPPYFVETTDKDKKPVTRWYSHDEPRFPVLPWEKEKVSKPDGKDGSGKKDKKPKPGGTGGPIRGKTSNNLLYKVGAIGGLGSLSAEKLRDRDRVLEKVEISFKTLELVFVIDDTFSMSEYFVAMGEAVESILKQAAADAVKFKDRTVSVAISYFSDYPKRDAKGNPLEKEKHTPLRASPLKPVITPGMKPGDVDAAVAKLVKAVKDKRYTEGGDEVEMVFDGIREAIDKAKFSRLARKVVVVIGDAGDRSREGKKVHTEKKKIVDRLFPANSAPIELYAIQVEEKKASGLRNTEAVLFQEQMEALRDLINEKLKEGKLAAYTHSSGIDSLKQSIKDRYDEIARQNAEIQVAVASLRRGEPNTKISPHLRVILEKANIKIDELKDLEGAQIFQSGFLWQFEAGQSRVAQAREVMLVSGADLNLIIDVLDALVGPNVRPNDPGAFAKAYRAAIKLATSDPNVDTLEAAFMAQGLKFTSPLLGKTAKELEKGLSKTERRDFYRKLQQFKDMRYDEDRGPAERDGVHVEYVWETTRDKSSGREIDVLKMKPGTKPEKRRRYFTRPGDPTKWYWIDTKEEMP